MSNVVRFPASRRTLLCGLATLPSLSVGAVASEPSALASASDWAVQHCQWINATGGHVEPWTDNKLTEETSRYWEAFDHVAAQPSGGLHDIQAKARLALHEMTDAGELENANPGLNLAAAVLREIIALGGTA